MSENPFTLTCEKVGWKDGSVNHFAKSDFRAFKELFEYDFTELERELDIDCFSCITSYKAIDKPQLMYNKNVSEKVRTLSERLELAKDVDEFFEVVTGFYKDIGVGAFGLNKAFRFRDLPSGSVEFMPINNMDSVVLSDLVGFQCSAYSSSLLMVMITYHWSRIGRTKTVLDLPSISISKYPTTLSRSNRFINSAYCLVYFSKSTFAPNSTNWLNRMPS